MEFKEFNSLMEKHFEAMSRDQFLFVADIDGDSLWDLYLDSFPPGTNEVYRKRREFDCGCCRNFVKAFGNVVAIRDNRLVSLWDFDPRDPVYGPVVEALADAVKSALVRDVFISKQTMLGTPVNREQREGGEVHTWNHFALALPKRLVTRSILTINALAAPCRDQRNVFKRSLDEIARESVETMLDLISEKSLYRGEEWQPALEKFLALHAEYRALPPGEKENYCWAKSVEVGGAVAKIRNHSVGVLLQDLTGGMELDEALRRYEAIVAPQNYKRPKPIFTAKMVEQAQARVQELGLLDSLGRRHATLSDITVNNVIWANRDAQKHMGGAGGVFDELRREVTANAAKYDRVPGVGVDQFVENVLPKTKVLRILLENHHESNLVSLIAPVVPGSPTLFKWGNAFSWAYNGNIADSLKQRVKAAGGNVGGVLRFSLQWNERGDNPNDFDAHCVEPNGNEIWFPNKGHRHPSTGMLDVDIINPAGRVAVENITWTGLDRMQEGVYKFFVHNYSHRGGRSGFDAEIEYGGQIHEYAYHKELAQSEKVVVAWMGFDRRKGIKFVEALPSAHSTKILWGLHTNSFHPASVCLFSPNYWDGQRGIGNKHYFFVLADCRNDSRPNGFFNEYLREEFNPHRKVFEALGDKMRVEAADDQLSGLGFSSTQRDSLIVEADGQMFKIVF